MTKPASLKELIEARNALSETDSERTVIQEAIDRKLGKGKTQTKAPEQDYEPPRADPIDVDQLLVNANYAQSHPPKGPGAGAYDMFPECREP